MNFPKPQPIEEASIKPFDKANWFLPASPQLLLSNGEVWVVGGYWYSDKGKGSWRVGGRVYDDLTHFMPLPPLPGGSL